jgi:hypothetical protein
MENPPFFIPFLSLAFFFCNILLDTTTVSIENRIDKVILQPLIFRMGMLKVYGHLKFKLIQETDY